MEKVEEEETIHAASASPLPLRVASASPLPPRATSAPPPPLCAASVPLPPPQVASAAVVGQIRDAASRHICAAVTAVGRVHTAVVG
uniref:Uncharacterized protein n=1 Tax=Oryza punctata TaxID=4537 RepID=A0A0E0KPD2_ORYPU